MKPKFIAIIGLVLLALCAFVVPVQAQQYAVTSVTITNHVPAATTDGIDSAAIALTRYEDIGIWWSFKMSAAATDNMTLTFKKSIDGTTYATTGGPSFVVAATGATTVNFVTNFTLGPVGYLKVDSIQNANGAAVALTNLYLKIVTKPRRNG